MTSLVVLDLIDKFESSSIYASMGSRIKVMRHVAQMNGTSAYLLENDILTVQELMYGMMLPSGNDAAEALGIHFGGILMSNGTKNPEIEVT
jgi:D-alanyl-D-alanine carboxypeptidase